MFRAVVLIAIGLCLVFIFQNCGQLKTAEKPSSAAQTWQDLYPFEKVEAFDLTDDMNVAAPKIVRLHIDHDRKEIFYEVFNQNRSGEPTGTQLCSKVLSEDYEKLRANFAQVKKGKGKPGMVYSAEIRPVGSLLIDSKVVEIFDANPFFESKESFDQQITAFRNCQ